MSYINGLGKNHAAEYKEFGEKILAENKEILKKAGVTPPLFNNDLEQDNAGLVFERTQVLSEDVDDDDDDDDEKKKKSSYKPSSISKNSTLTDVRSSAGMKNTVYKNSIKSSNMVDKGSDDPSPSLDEFNDSLETSNGSNDNDDLADFMSREYEKGLHLNGGGYAYYEKNNESTNTSFVANVTGSYTTKNGNFSLSYGGSFEYAVNNDNIIPEIESASANKPSTDSTQTKTRAEDSAQTPSQPADNNTNKSDDKSGNAILMAKYKDKNLTYAAGGTANIYDNNTRLYNIYAGVMHNSTGIAATLRRKIEVSFDANGKLVDNQTDVKLHLLKPKKAATPTDVAPELPTPDETKEHESLVNTDKQEVEEIAGTGQGAYGFGLNLKLATAQQADEYGVEVKNTSLITKKTDDKNVVTLTPYAGLYDYHPNTNEGIKVRTGVMATLDSQINNDLSISSQAIIDNKRIMQGGYKPSNTFMAVLDTAVNYKKLSVVASTGYINSNSEVKYSFINGGIKYTMKNSELSGEVGWQEYGLKGDENKIFHAGLRYAVNF